MPEINDEIRKMIEQRLDRRSFLRGSALSAAALVGVAALPRLASAQAPQESKPGDKPAEKPQEIKDEKPAEKPADPAKPADQEQDPFKVTKIDDKGKPYRVCPQCGYNMYQQDKVWTCENCGYSYTE
jgi:secreted PhoX family phosphatase